MLLLGVDTSGPEGSLALARGDQELLTILEVVPLAGGTYSAQLIPQLTSLLARHNVLKSDLDGFAVASGPGSFTGLRVGLSAMKALAEVLGKLIAAVSVLEALAAGAGKPGRVIAATDAGRKQVYVGEYEVDSTRPRMLVERLLTNEEFAGPLASYVGVSIVTPDQYLADLVKHAPVQVLPRPRADAYARLGLAKIIAGETTAPEDIEANYIRRSDAEIFADPGALGGSPRSR